MTQLKTLVGQLQQLVKQLSNHVGGMQGGGPAPGTTSPPGGGDTAKTADAAGGGDTSKKADAAGGGMAGCKMHGGGGSEGATAGSNGGGTGATTQAAEGAAASAAATGGGDTPAGGSTPAAPGQGGDTPATPPTPGTTPPASPPAANGHEGHQMPPAPPAAPGAATPAAPAPAPGTDPSATHQHEAMVPKPGSTKSKYSTESLIHASIKGTSKLRTPAAAKKAGYVANKKEMKDGSAFVHFVKKPNYKDGKVLNAKAPEVLLFRRDPAGKWTLAGVMYRTGKGEISPVVGQNGVFHGHMKGGKMANISGKDRTGGMLHVWFTKDMKGAHGIGAPEDVKQGKPYQRAAA